MSGITNNVNVTGNTSSNITQTQNTVGTPNPSTVSALQSQLNPSGTSVIGSTSSHVSTNASSASAASTSSTNSADMKSFLDSVNQFCVQQGILTTPDPTDN